MRFSLAIASTLLTVSLPLWAAEADEKTTDQHLEVGDPAPSFKVNDDSGKVWSSEEHIGEKILVVYFYPADMTGGCTAQACGFRDDMSKLKSKGVEVVGVSGDSVKNHQLFKKAHDLNFTLLADVDGEVADAFGVPKTEGERVVSRTIDGVSHDLTRDITTRRWTFIINRDGKIAYVDDSVNAKRDSEAVMEAVETLK